MNAGRPRGAVRDNAHMQQLTAVPGAIVYGVHPGEYDDEARTTLRVAEYSGFSAAEPCTVPASGGGNTPSQRYPCLQALVSHGQPHRIKRKLVARNHNLDAPEPISASYLFGTRARAQAYANTLQQAAGVSVNNQAGAVAARSLDPETTGLAPAGFGHAARTSRKMQAALDAKQAALEALDAKLTAERAANARKLPSAFKVGEKDGELYFTDGTSTAQNNLAMEQIRAALDSAGNRVTWAKAWNGSTQQVSLKQHAQRAVDRDSTLLKNFSKYITHDPYDVEQIMRFKPTDIKKGKW